MKRLIAACAFLMFGCGLSQAHERTMKQLIIQKSKEGKLSCSVTRTLSGHMEYSAAGPSMKSLKRLPMLKCFSKALRTRPAVAHTGEETVTAQIHFEVLGIMRCYRTNVYIVKFPDEIPDNVEGITSYCYKKAWDAAQDKDILRSWI